MSIKRLTFSLLATALLSACASTPGSAPGSVPPQLVRDQSSGKLAWSDPGAFGPVPASLQKKGDAVCRTRVPGETNGDHKHAIGYHPSALDLNGNPFPGGGYFCE